MNVNIRIAVLLLAAAGLVGASAGCSSSTAGTGTGGGANSKPSMECMPGVDCPGDSHGGSNPQPTNPGAGQVSGICHFGLQSSSGDKGAAGSGLRPKQMSPVLINLVGLVYGYCTDIVRDFTLDLHIYGGPPGTHTGGTDFTKNKRAHELSYREVKSPIPGPVPTPYAITMPCIPGLELQLVYTLTARDEAGNFIGSGPNGGSIVQFTASQCGAAS